jgi:hypothetical protein
LLRGACWFRRGRGRCWLPSRLRSIVGSRLVLRLDVSGRIVDSLRSLRTQQFKKILEDGHGIVVLD